MLHHFQTSLLRTCFAAVSGPRLASAQEPPLGSPCGPVKPLPSWSVLQLAVLRRCSCSSHPCAREPLCLTPAKGKEGGSLGEAAENRQFWLHCEGSRRRAVRKRRAGIEQEREGFVHRKARVSDRKQLKCLFFSPDRWRLYRWRRLHCS